jgi:hypothetical protein
MCQTVGEGAHRAIPSGSDDKINILGDGLLGHGSPRVLG